VRDFHGRSFLRFIGRAPNKASVPAPEYEPTSDAATRIAAKHTCLTVVSPRYHPTVYAVASNVGENIAVNPPKCPKRTIPQ
jgi:hypothetical protein